MVPVGGGEQRFELAAEVVCELVGDPVAVAGGPVETTGEVPQAALHRHAGEALCGQGGQLFNASASVLKTMSCANVQVGNPEPTLRARRPVGSAVEEAADDEVESRRSGRFRRLLDRARAP